ncbi:unnamed protein product [Peniophora sp. CBMAI 1063]|nr:unnamed protein product [Peniophora sp. CBMAI 1063]
MGTWQFVSIALVTRSKGHRYSEQDDLESVLWVVAYCLARYTNLYSGSNKALVEYLYTCFDAAHTASRQHEGLPEAHTGGDAKRRALQNMSKLPNMSNGGSSFLSDGTHPAIRYLLIQLARSLCLFLQRRSAEAVLLPFGDNSPEEDDPTFDDYFNADVVLDVVKKMEKRSFPFTHQNIAKTLETAREKFVSTDLSSSSSEVYGSKMLPDRVKAHHADERRREEAKSEDYYINYE